MGAKTVRNVSESTLNGYLKGGKESWNASLLKENSVAESLPTNTFHVLYRVDCEVVVYPLLTIK